MTGFSVAGRIALALAITAIGVTSLGFGEYVSGLQPLPADLPGHRAIALASGAALLLCGLGMLSLKTARLAAFVLAALMLTACVAIHLPILLQNVRVGYSWVRLFEPLALTGAALTLTASLDEAKNAAKTIATGRWLFGISLPVFAATHFSYPDIVASLIPAWIPAHLFLAYFTGAAHLFAGLAIVNNIMARWAAILAGAMYGSWALILHLPRVMADTGNQGEITSLFMAVALCGAAWLVAGVERKTVAAVESYA